MRPSQILSHACAAVLVSAVAVGAQEVRVPSATVFAPRVFAPPPASSPALSLSEAVRLTILHNPTVTARTQALEQAAGQLVAATPAGSAAWRDVLAALLAKARSWFIFRSLARVTVLPLRDC